MSLRETWNKLSYKKNLTREEALAAVKNDGYALKYVEERILDLIESPNCLTKTIQIDGKTFKLIEVKE